MRKCLFSLGTVLIMAAAIAPAAPGRADDQAAKSLRSSPAPSAPVKSFSSLKLPASDYSITLQTERVRGSHDRAHLPTGLPLAKREPAMPFVGLSVSKPLGVQK